VSRADDNFHFAVAVQIERRDDFIGVRRVETGFVGGDASNNFLQRSAVGDHFHQQFELKAEIDHIMDSAHLEE